MSAVETMTVVACALVVGGLVAVVAGFWTAHRKAKRDGVLP